MTETIQQWYTALTPNEQVFWTIALIASAVFIIQAVMTLLGMDADYDFSDGDTMDLGGAMSLFTIRSVVNFFVGFGWCGVTMTEKTESSAMIYIVSCIVGCCFSYSWLFLKKKLKALESNGSINLNECIGMEGAVYLRIPGGKKGKGKVQISVNGSIHEFDAVTQGENIPTGETIRITGIEGNTLVVEGV